MSPLLYHWKYSGGGGYDTACYSCECGAQIAVPGIRQIFHYGKSNWQWWKLYFFKRFFL